MAKGKQGVDSYGSMKGFICLRSEKENFDEDGIDGNNGDEIEKRLDRNLSRFKMIYPNSHRNHTLEKRIVEHETQIAHLEGDNHTLKKRIFLMESEIGELKRRVMCLETDVIGGKEPETFHHNIAGEVCSKKSIGNDHNGHDKNNADCV